LNSRRCLFASHLVSCLGLWGGQREGTSFFADSLNRGTGMEEEEGALNWDREAETGRGGARARDQSSDKGIK